MTEETAGMVDAGAGSTNGATNAAGTPTGQVSPQEGTDNGAEGAKTPDATSDVKATDGKSDGADNATPNTSNEGQSFQDRPTGDNGSYDAGGDESMQQVYDTFSTLGLTPDMAKVAFAKADATGNPEDIDYSHVEQALGKQKADAIRAVTDAYYQKASAQDAQVRAVCDKVAGGTEQWDAVKSWAEDSVKLGTDNADKIKELAGMFGQNDAMTEFAASQLKTLFAADPNTTRNANITKGDAGAKDTPAEMTKGEFSKQMLEAMHSGDVAKQNQLRALRNASRKAGH